MVHGDCALGGRTDMIKVIAFDLVGVLVSESDVVLTKEEGQLERMFGPNINDSDYLIKARKIISKDSIIMRMTEDIIDKIYNIRDKNLFYNLKNKYKDKKIVIATNHVSFVRNYIGESFGVEYLDDVIISAEIHMIKPNKDFYEFILNKFEIKPEELLLLDDNQKNIDSAKNMGIITIKVDKDTDLYDEIIKCIEKNS